MKKGMFCLVLLMLVSLVTWGCARTDSSSVASSTTTGQEHDHDHDGDADHAGDADHDAAAGGTVEVALVYCGSCGHGFSKGTDHACDGDHAKCADCGLHKGAELCCKLEGDFAGQMLCGSCGQVGGSEACCKEGATKCAGCGLDKGSPLCCKLGPAEEGAAAPDAGAPSSEG